MIDPTILISAAPVLGTAFVAILGYFKLKRSVDASTTVQITEQVNRAHEELRLFLVAQLKEAERRNEECEKERGVDRKKHAEERTDDELRYRKVLKEQTEQFILIDKMRRALIAANIKNI